MPNDPGFPRPRQPERTRLLLCNVALVPYVLFFPVTFFAPLIVELSCILLYGGGQRPIASPGWSRLQLLALNLVASTILAAGIAAFPALAFGWYWGFWLVLAGPLVLALLACAPFVYQSTVRDSRGEALYFVERRALPDLGINQQLTTLWPADRRLQPAYFLQACEQFFPEFVVVSATPTVLRVALFMPVRLRPGAVSSRTGGRFCALLRIEFREGQPPLTTIERELDIEPGIDWHLSVPREEEAGVALDWEQMEYPLRPSSPASLLAPCGDVEQARP